MPTRLLLTRHGETRANVERRLVGHGESPLTERGRRQALALAERLQREPIAAVYASDLTRCCETAALAIAGRHIEVAAEPGLRELHFGDWEGRTFDEVQAGWPDAWSRLLAIDETFCAPGGEPVVAASARIAATMAAIADRHAGKSVLIVAHGGTLYLYLSHLRGTPLSGTVRVAAANCALTLVELHEDGPRLTIVNDDAHLARIDAGGSQQ